MGGHVFVRQLCTFVIRKEARKKSETNTSGPKKVKEREINAKSLTHFNQPFYISKGRKHEHERYDDEQNELFA